MGKDLLILRINSNITNNIIPTNDLHVSLTGNVLNFWAALRDTNDETKCMFKVLLKVLETYLKFVLS